MLLDLFWTLYFSVIAPDIRIAMNTAIGIIARIAPKLRAIPNRANPITIAARDMKYVIKNVPKRSAAYLHHVNCGMTDRIAFAFSVPFFLVFRKFAIVASI